VPPAPAQPYPHAADFEPPVTVEEPEAEPIPLTSDDVPTMQDLRDQIGAVSSHLQVVHREASLGRAAAVNAGLEAKACRGDVAELRALVLGDHAPRITQVEARTSRITIPPSAKAGGIGVGAGGIVVAIVELWPIVQRWLETR
jgi:hypothetical protein